MPKLLHNTAYWFYMIKMDIILIRITIKDSFTFGGINSVREQIGLSQIWLDGETGSSFSSLVICRPWGRMSNWVKRITEALVEELMKSPWYWLTGTKGAAKKSVSCLRLQEKKQKDELRSHEYSRPCWLSWAYNNNKIRAMKTMNNRIKT